MMDNNIFSNYETVIENTHKTLSVRVYDMILNLIIEGELKVDERINSDMIAKSFGVSRTPVREALKSLEKTGLVQFKSYSGAYVRKLTIAEIEEIYSIRMQLEAFAIKKAVDSVSDSDIKKLQKIQDEIEFMISRNPIDVKKIYDLNERFHMELYMISEMPKLCEIIENLWINLSLYRFLLASNQNYSSEIKSEHQEYIRCLVERDKDKIIEMVVKNLENHLQRVPKLVNEYYQSI